MFDQISLELKPSIVISIIIAMPSLCALVLIGTRDIQFPLMMLLTCPIICITGYYIYLFGLLRLKPSVTQIKLLQNTLSIKHGNNALVTENFVTIDTNSFTSPWSCILTTIPTNITQKRFTILVCKYNVKHSDDFRRLRVWLKYGNAPDKQTIKF